MAAELLGTHRILLAFLEIKETVTRDIKSRYTIEKIAKLLLKASGQKLLNSLEEPMDEHSKHDSKESVRRTIMEHDKVFRQQNLHILYFLLHQVHELHRLYHVQKSLMSEVGCGKHRFQCRTEETQEMVQRSRSNHNRSPSTSETNQSACFVTAQHSAPPQVPEHLGLQECKPRTCLSLFSEENSATKEGNHAENPVGSHNIVEDENLSSCVGSDLDLKLSLGPSSPATKRPHWLFSGSRERNPSGQHR
ncbi:hypothetical protein HU200_059326 [Digitaria exilis]|uniref:Uncharacterized protein n=1 Tax=Digitaria exilis TaxID=1010633 RepID=A0A835AH39_9POAL|nr:hypothetical protein HU200_059326 [Digitaria exilis]